MNENNTNENNTNGQFSPQPSGLGISITSVVLGIVSIIIFCCFHQFSFIFGIIGLILGIVSIKNGYQGRGLAIAGIVTSSVSLVLVILGEMYLNAFFNNLMSPF